MAGAPVPTGSANVDHANHSPGTTKPKRKPVWVKDLGLTLLYEPEDRSAIVADVVFVHGLQGRPYRTWRFKGTVKETVLNEDPQPSKRFRMLKKKPPKWRTAEVQREAFWPADFLPDDVPNARIFTYGYDSDVSHGIYGPANQNGISQHGLGFLNAVSNTRHDCPDRPLIFVAHSLGGLLVKQALVESWKASQDGQDRNLHNVCKGVIFFGTPHRGSADASWGTLIANIARIAQFDANKSILHDLDPSTGSSTLADLQTDFNALLHRQLFKVFTFQEAAGKAGLNILSSKVVPDESSSFGFRAFEMRDTINRNHMDMCRFEGSADEGYIKSLGALRGFLRVVQVEGEQATQTLLEKHGARHQGLLDNLKFAEKSTRERQIKDAGAQASSADWIWAVDNVHSSITRWLQNDQPIFWIQGKPGSGKSTLMEYLSRADKVKDLLTSSSSSVWKIAYFFFDFRADKGLANNLEGLLRSLCFQVVEIFGDLPGLELNLHQPADKSDKKSTPWSLSALRQALVKVLQQASKNLCIFIDGLDEYQGDVIELIRFLQNLPCKGSNGNAHKLCLASRPEPNLNLVLKAYPGLSMQDYNFRGIENYVLTAVQSLHLPASDQSLLCRYSSSIVTRAEGVFLWVRFAVQEMIDSYARGESFEELWDRLEALPSSMRNLYGHMLKRMRVEDRNEARLLLQLTSSAINGTLTTRQLKGAVRVAKNESFYLETDGDTQTVEKFRVRLRAKSGGLLEETFRKNVKIIHRSVHSFLEDEGWFQEIKIGVRNYTSPDALWLFICCECIRQSFTSLHRLFGHKIFVDLPPKLSFSLWGYAVSHLFDHARRVEENTHESSFSPLSSVPKAFFKELNPGSHLRVPYLDDGGHISLHLGLGTIHSLRGDQPWQIVFEEGLALCAIDALQTREYTVYPNSIDVALALVSNATDKTRLRLVSTVTEYGAAVSDKDIVICLFRGTITIMQLLLATRPSGKLSLSRCPFYSPTPYRPDLYMDGPNPKYVGETVGPLWELARFHYVRDSWVTKFNSFLDFFLGRGETLDDICGPGGAILHAIVLGAARAIYLDRFSRAKLAAAILIRGASVDVPGPRGTPLRMAWRMIRFYNLEDGALGTLQCLLVLLKHRGANCNWVEPDGSIVAEEQINDLCHMNVRDLRKQNHKRFQCPDWYTWDVPISTATARVKPWSPGVSDASLQPRMNAGWSSST